MNDFEDMLKYEIPEPKFVEVQPPPPPEPAPTPEPVIANDGPSGEQVPSKRATKPKSSDADKTPIYLVRGDNGTLYNKDAEDMEVKFRSDFAEAVQEALRKTIERRNRVRYLQDKLGLK